MACAVRSPVTNGQRDAIARGDYPVAGRRWGCTEQSPASGWRRLTGGHRYTTVYRARPNAADIVARVPSTAFNIVGSFPVCSPHGAWPSWGRRFGEELLGVDDYGRRAHRAKPSHED